MVSQPGNVFLLVSLAVFFGILAGLLLHKTIGCYVEGTIGGLECILITGLYLGLIISVVTLRVLPVLVILILLVSLLILPRWRERRADHCFHDERIEQYKNAITSDPLNMAARSRLAEELYTLGRLDEAIAEQTELVRMCPSSPEEVRRLEQFIQERQEKVTPPISCPSCGHKNPPERTRCGECEGELRISSELKQWLARGGIRQIAVTSAITVTVIIIVLFALSALSIFGRILLVALFLVIVTLAELLHAYRSL